MPCGCYKHVQSGGKEVSADDYLVIGTVDREVWKQGLQTPLPVPDIVDHLHVFEDVVSFEVRGGWMLDEEANRLAREEKQLRAAWKKKIAAQKKARSTV